MSKAHSGTGNPFYGKHHTEKTKIKVRKTHKRLGIKPPHLSKEKAPNWQGGITPENENIRHSVKFDLWREAVYTRDNYTCQKCKKKGIRLHAHHIYNFAIYKKLRFIVKNGITFCKDCHIEFHKIYGYKNNTKEQLKEFLKQIL